MINLVFFTKKAKTFEDCEDRIEPFLDVPGMLELRELLISFKDDEKFIFLSNNITHTMWEVFRDNRQRYDFTQAGYKGLSSSKYMFKGSILSFSNLCAVYSVIMFTRVCDYRRLLSYEEEIELLGSNLVPKLTVALEDYLNIGFVPSLDKAFFKNLGDIKNTEDAESVDESIYNGYWHVLALKHDLDYSCAVDFNCCANYFAACYALRDGRGEVSQEDIVKGWILTLNVFLTDFRSYFYMKKLDSNNKTLESKDMIYVENKVESKFGLSKPLAIICSILFFIFLMFIILILLVIFVGDAIYDIGRWPGLIALFVCAYLTSKFYDKILKEEP